MLLYQEAVSKASGPECIHRVSRDDRDEPVVCLDFTKEKFKTQRYAQVPKTHDGNEAWIQVL